MRVIKAKLEKKTIYRYKYGRISPEKPFKVKELLMRNASNHVLLNKRAIKTPNAAAGSHAKPIAKSSYLDKRKNNNNRKREIREPNENNYELFMDHLLNYAEPSEVGGKTPKAKKLVRKIPKVKDIEEEKEAEEKFVFLKRKGNKRVVVIDKE